jgi:hypothetical protein
MTKLYAVIGASGTAYGPVHGSEAKALAWLKWFGRYINESLAVVEI